MFVNFINSSEMEADDLGVMDFVAFSCIFVALTMGIVAFGGILSPLGLFFQFIPIFAVK